MDQIKAKWRSARTAIDAEHLLESYYDQLRKWGAILTRGDTGMAQEIVHDLCLYFTVAKPDLSRVENLDGYLYTSLRHIYLSALARSSREAVQLVSIADSDSIQFALNTNTTDNLLERQNELRRICSYAVWRKDSSKSASYFLLLFFHEYARREVAEIARLPIAAVYNKLKVAREELASHLAASGKLRIASRDVPPDPELRVIAVSSAELFQELRETIFEAKSSECLSVETLLAQYSTANPKPIPCGLLSHIVSCDRCLSLLDRHFQRPAWEDREPPGSSWSFKDGDGGGSAAHHDPGYHAMMASVRRQKGRIYEHRPRTLSIAVNGKIVAFHDVQSERSTLASRAEHPETVQFVEVFSDQQIRLALLTIEDLPPRGLHAQTQQVALSDDRWLELKVSFDGMGLHSEVTYLDPALAAETPEEAPDDTLLAAESAHPIASLPATITKRKSESMGNRIIRSIHAMTPRFALAWAMILAAVLGGTGYFAYLYMHTSLDARTILNDSVRIEVADVKGEARHQVLRLDALGASGQTVWQGTVDVWQEPADGRTMRRLYNTKHRLVAAEWHGKNSESGSYIAPAGGAMSQTEREIAGSAYWNLDVSARTFQALAARQMEIRTTGGDYELTGTGFSSGPPHLVSATLNLDRRLHLVGETLSISSGSGFSEVRFVETHDERLPIASVPDSVFEPSDLESRLPNNLGGPSVHNGIGDRVGGTNPGLVQTEVAVLYRLSELGADVGEPIQITRTPSGHIRVAGTVANEARKKQIVAALENVPDRQLLEIQLATQGSLRIPTPASRPFAPPTSVYDVARTAPPADLVLRRYFADKGRTGEQIDSAVAQFSRDALDHAQRALQNAYALDRLGTSFTADELRNMNPVSQQQWSVMVAQHSSALKTELDELQQQLTQLVPEGGPPLSMRRFSQIDTPADFARRARTLLVDTQNLNRVVGNAFSSGLAGAGTRNPDSSIDAILQSIPLIGAEQLTEFASRLANGKDTANRSVERYPRLPR